MDNVTCLNCRFDGLVEHGEEICPECKIEGCLAWKPDEPQEIN
jgi:RNA polymerase subunit RPABC4/transcription elongation factor Spt4